MSGDTEDCETKKAFQFERLMNAKSFIIIDCGQDGRVGIQSAGFHTEVQGLIEHAHAVYRAQSIRMMQPAVEKPKRKRKAS